MSTVVEHLGVAQEGPMSGYHVFKVGSVKVAVGGRPGNLSFWKAQKGRLVSHFFRDKSVFNRILHTMMDIRKVTTTKEPPAKTWNPPPREPDREIQPAESQPDFWWTKD